MDPLEQLAYVAGQAEFESTGEARPPPTQKTGRACGHGASEPSAPTGSRLSVDPRAPNCVEVDGRYLPIHMAAAGGRRIPLLKAMLTTACELDCFYCPFRAGRNTRRVSFKPEAMAKAFDAVHRVGLVEGLFLSTGILRGGVATQDQLIDTALILRRKLKYRGYLHLKIMPGAEKDQVLRAMQLADRVSINLEAPNENRLERLAPNKSFFEQLLRPLKWTEEIRRSVPPPGTWRGSWASTTTQFVVGAAGESDVEVLSTVDRLFGELDLRRAYFEAFSPVPDTPLENQSGEDPQREHRLYQASFLLRDYGFDLEELPFKPDGRLPLNFDPKQASARERFSESPVEINRASRMELMRVPGIGPRGADAILSARGREPLANLGDLKRIGIAAGRATPFITLNGKRPARQLQLL